MKLFTPNHTTISIIKIINDDDWQESEIIKLKFYYDKLYV